ncbi:MAG TPA: DUF11 domain-containing protein, partial [Thermoplasmatales archaeon]|nr:DUF11 domain-containing protein [Thermoplasmatales archaeon]
MINQRLKLAGIVIFAAACIASVQFYGSGERATDTTPPVTTKGYIGPLYVENGTEWISNQTIVVLNATDDMSGAYSLHYRVYRDSNNDGDVDTLVHNVSVYDNAAGDYNPATGEITAHVLLTEECLHRIEYYSMDYDGNREEIDALVEEWRHWLRPKVTHVIDNVIFGSSPAIANITGDADLEIYAGSDEKDNYYPELGDFARGIWRCYNADGSLLFALDTNTDESRSSPAIADIDNDGTKELVGGTTSGWYVECMSYDDVGGSGQFEWAFPAASTFPVPGGNYVWHSSPALADVNESVDGTEVIIGNNPHNGIWCFDGDNSDGIDEGIHITPGDFPGFLKPLGTEGIEWDAIWKYPTADSVIASPAVGDVDNDGELEVVVGSLDKRLYILDAATGTKEWSYIAGGSIWSSAALANIDGDPYLEILFGANNGKLYCIQWSGTSGSKQWSYTTGDDIYSSPAVGDVNGDGNYEIVFGSTDGNVYCLDASGSLLWNVTTGGAIYSSPSFAYLEAGTHAEEWPMFRKNQTRNGFYEEKGRRLEIFIASEDEYLYDIDGYGNVVHTFRTNGPVHTSPSIGDVDGDGFLNIVFYDWGKDVGLQDTFWCLERIYKNVDYFRVDAYPPQTIKKVMSENEYYIESTTDIWLNSTDPGNCSTGVHFLHYEIYWDFNGNGVVDTQVGNYTIYDNEEGDLNPAEGEISVMFHLTNYGVNEIRWYGEDYVENREEIHYQEHNVTVYAPILHIIKSDNPDPVQAGGEITYTIFVNNSQTATANATGVIIIDDYDESILTILDADGGVDNGNIIIWDGGITLPIGANITHTVTAQVHYPLPDGTVFYNYVSVSCAEGVSDNDTEDTTVVSQPELHIIKTDAPDPTQAGGQITYTLTVNNTGNANATDVTVTETYDPAVSFASATPAPTSGDNIWTISSLAPGEEWVITITVNVASPLPNGTIAHNYVTVTCTEGST